MTAAAAAVEGVCLTVTRKRARTREATTCYNISENRNGPTVGRPLLQSLISMCSFFSFSHSLSLSLSIYLFVLHIFSFSFTRRRFIHRVPITRMSFQEFFRIIPVLACCTVLHCLNSRFRYDFTLIISVKGKYTLQPLPGAGV